MNSKHLVNAAARLSLLLIFVFAVCTVCFAQSPPAAIATPNAGENARAPVAPQLKTEDLLKIRELQVEQAKRVIRRQEIEREWDELQKAIEAGMKAIRMAADAATKNADVDLGKWQLNGDTLKLAPRENPTTEKPATPAVNSKPGTPN